MTLEAFTGDYKGPGQLDSAIHLSVEHGNLILRNRSNSPVTLAPIANNECKIEANSSIVSHRDEHGSIRAERARTPSARGIAFACIY
jgi:hypothetical protein